ncbi:hypothetical protein H7X65_03895 [Candidatus Parcubacteria bacterium]|nr:hypothetical protein [Candidatus Parcubacteria bacterium]
MNKKRLSYILLTLSVCLLSFSVYATANVIKEDLMSDEWVLKEVAQTSMGTNTKAALVDDLIEKYAADPSIKKTLEKQDSANNDYTTIKKKLGLENISKYDGVIGTSLGCSIVTLKQAGEIRYKWVNQLEDGTIRLVIKDIDKKIVYENDAKNISIQGEITLPAGDYFIFVEWSVQNNLRYNLYCREKEK